MHKTLFAVPIVAMGLSACAIHPQVQDFSRAALPHIVTKIRCELREAIAQNFPDPKDYLLASGLKLDFQFTLTENDDATSTGGVTIPISLGTFKIGWDAGVEKERETTINLGLVTTLAEIIAVKNCDSGSRRNYLYPITGNIGLRETLHNFAFFARGNKGGLDTFSDRVKFTTDLKAELTPSIRLVPKTSRLITANLKLLGHRKDVHRLTLTFTAAKDPVILAREEAKKKKKTKEAEISARKKLLAESAIPKSIVLVTPNGTPVDPREIGRGQSFSFAPLNKDGSQQLNQTEQKNRDARARRALRSVRSKTVRDAPIAQGFVRRPTSRRESAEEIKQRTLRDARRNETLRIDSEILDELRSR